MQNNNDNIEKSINLLDNISNDESIDNFELPIYIKLFFLIFAIITLSILIYFYYNSLQINNINIFWIYTIAIINIINIIIVLLYYNYKTTSTSSIYDKNGINKKGIQGKKGKIGKRGKTGKYITCSYCNTNLYIETTKKYNNIASLLISPTNISDNMINFKYIQDILNIESNNEDTSSSIIDYATLISNIMKSEDAISENTAKFILLYKDTFTLQQVTLYILNPLLGRSTNENIGNINRPFGKVGFLPMGDSILGGLENFDLNYFMITGDIMYPAKYDKLVTFPIMLNNEGEIEYISIWRPIENKKQITSNTSNISMTNSINKFITYKALGDIAQIGTSSPELNTIAMIAETCIEEIPPKNLDLIFMHTGVSGVGRVDRMDNMKQGELQLFSVWRTPVNTFITNIPTSLQNTTVGMNILKIDGKITGEDKQNIIKTLSAIQIPKILSALYIVSFYEQSNWEELYYYINKNVDKNLILKNGIRHDMTISQLNGLINKAHNTYLQYISNPLNQYQSKKHIKTDTDIDIKYGKLNRNVKVETITDIPVELKNAQIRVQRNIDNMAFQIDNTYTMYDLLLVLFANGIDTYINVDNVDNIDNNDNNTTEYGGDKLNKTQEIFLNICQIIFPPQLVYYIKDECLGTYQRNKTKDNAIQDFEDELIKNKKLIEEYKNNPEKQCSNWEAVNKYMMKTYDDIGSYVGHIDNYMDKIDKMNLDEFSMSKILSITKLYKKLNKYIEGNCL